MKKICYFIGSLATGGAEGQLIELIRGLDRDRFEPSVILETEQGTERAAGLVTDLRVLRKQSKPLKSNLKRIYHGVLSLQRLSSHLSEIQPDILHAFLPAACIFSAAARMLGNSRCVISSRRSLVDSYRPNNRLNAAGDFLATRACDFILCNSEAVAREVVELDHVPRSRTAVIYNGVDTKRFSPAQNKCLRSKLGWNESHIVFGMIANFIPYKRHLDFVRAAKIIHASVPNSRFLLVGEDRGEQPVVQRALAESGLADFATIIPGTKAPELAFAAMDVYICTSETEGFPNVLLEAMASALPVVATAVGGNQEAIAVGVTGFIVPPHAPELIAREAVALAMNPDRMPALSHSARRRAEEKFSLESMVRSHEEVYERLLQWELGSPWKRLAARGGEQHD